MFGMFLGPPAGSPLEHLFTTGWIGRQIGRRFKPSQQQGLFQIQAERPQKAAHDQQIGFKKTFSLDSGRTKNGVCRARGGSGRERPVALGSIDQSLEQGRGAIKIDRKNKNGMCVLPECVEDLSALILGIQGAGIRMGGAETAVDAGLNRGVAQVDGVRTGPLVCGRFGKQVGYGVRGTMGMRTSNKDLHAGSSTRGR